MPTLRFTATKMSDAKVSHISLVERGANRIPFKVVKEESDTMSTFSGLDLGSLFARKAEKTPEVSQIIGVVTLKGESLGRVQKAVEEAGFDATDTVELDDGSVVFKQEGFSDEALAEGVVVRLSESVALVTKGFSPYNMDLSAGDVSFADQCAASGFYPAINSIMTTLSDAVRAVVYNAKTPSEAKSAVSKLFAEASAYTTSFVSALPVKAFKMEDLAVGIPLEVEKADCKAKAKTPEGTEGGKTVEEDPAKTAKKAEGDETDETGSAGSADGETVQKNPEGAETALTDEKVADIVAAKVEEATSGLVAKFEEIIATLGAVQKSVKGFEEASEDLRARTEKAEQLAADSAKAVKGMVVVGSGADDQEPSPTVQKREMRGDIDTAFQPRRSFPGKR